MFPWYLLIFLKRSLVFPTLLFSSISLHWSLRKALSLLAILWNSAFKWVYLSFSPLLLASLLFTAICKASSDSHFAFLHFFSLGMILLPRTWLSDWTELNWTGGSDGKESACNEGDPSLIPGLGRSLGEGKGYPLQYSSQENSMDRGAWRATVHKVAKSQTRLSNWHFHLHFIGKLPQKRKRVPQGKGWPQTDFQWLIC